MKKIKTLILILFSLLLLSSCKATSNTKKLKNLYFSYQNYCTELRTIFDNGFNFTEENTDFILKQSNKFLDSINEYISDPKSLLTIRMSSDKELSQDIYTTVKTIVLVFTDIKNNPELNNDEEKQYFNLLLSQLNEQMNTLEYNNLQASEEIIEDYVKYFIIFIIFFFILCIVLLVIFIFELKQRDIKLLETSEFLDYTIQGQEEEKQRIARDLHDTVAQDIRYIIHLTKKLDSSPLQKDILTKQENCLKQVRDICSSFVPQDIANKDLISCLNDVISSIKSQTNMEIKLTILDNISFKNMDEERLLHFFRIIQESLNNAAKHSQGSEISILIKKEIIDDENLISLIITDDGVGIDKQILDSIKEEKISVAKNHFGLKNIIQRVKLLNGKIEITSDKDFGTEISVLIPE